MKKEIFFSAVVIIIFGGIWIYDFEVCRYAWSALIISIVILIDRIIYRPKGIFW